jgi:4-amino-4-deoxy-L-arabinose transferase-like glycosyltransferase
MVEPYIGTKANVFIIFLISIVSLIYIIYCKKNNCLNYKTITLLVLVIGVLIRNLYILKTNIYQRQHDVETLDSNGHLRYIYDLYKTGKLPVSNDWQLYHPPFFHLIGAGWLKINSIIGLPLERSLEGLQILTVIFSSLTMMVSYLIIDKLKIKDKYKFLLNAFMAFYPTFIILSGSINNDCLLTLLEFSIIYYLINWYKNTSWSNTVILAILTGLCVMTKLNGAIMAIPILYVFIKKFIEIYKKDKKKVGKLITKILIFSLISLPIGLWYQVREYILFESNSVPIPGDFLYTGNYSIFDRFIKISFISIIKVFCQIPGDYNVFAYIVKCSIFGEYTYENMSYIHILMIFTNFILIIASIIYMIKYLFKKKEHNFITNLLLIVWLVNIVSYYSFNYKYPYLCTMDFRYMIPTVFTGIVIIVKNLNMKNNLVNTFVEVCLLTFIGLCFIFPFTI